MKLLFATCVLRSIQPQPLTILLIPSFCLQMRTAPLCIIYLLSRSAVFCEFFIFQPSRQELIFFLLYFFKFLSPRVSAILSGLRAVFLQDLSRCVVCCLVNTAGQRCLCSFAWALAAFIFRNAFLSLRADAFT